MSEPILAHSATKLERCAGGVVVCGSHGGRYAGLLALAAGVRAILLNDAGVGLDEAGIAGLSACEAHAVPAASLSHATCRIGNARSALEDGIVSHVNANAAALRVAPGDSAASACARLAQAPDPGPAVPMPQGEHRSERRLGSVELVVMDSHGLVRAGEDDGKILITASHGGLLGDDPASAGKAAALLLAFNDAGVGKDGAGISRLPVLEGRGVAAVTVAHTSARIGDGASTLATGRISHANGAAERLGARAGIALSALVERIAGAAL